MTAGRPAKLTDDIELKIAKMLQLGLDRSTAARAAGIDPATLRRWVVAGESGKSYGRLPATRMRRFVAALEAAEAKSEASALLIIRQAAGEGEWKAAAWILERIYRGRYARSIHHEVDVSVEVPVQTWTPRADIAELTEKPREIE